MLFIYITRLASNEIFSPSNKIHREVGRVTDLSAPLVGFQEVEAPRISRHTAHEGGKVVSPTHRPPLSPRRYPWYSLGT